MINLEGDGPFKIVSAADVDIYADGLGGWTVAAMYQEQTATLRTDQEPDPQATYMGVTMEVERYHPCTVTYFVLRQTSDEALRAAVIDRDVARDKRKQAEAAAEFAEEAREKAEREQKELSAQVQAANARSGQLSERSTDLTRQLRTIEGDLAKVRKAIGDRAWNEILQPAQESEGA